MTSDIWLTIAEASIRSGVPERTLARWCTRKKNKNPLPSKVDVHNSHWKRLVKQSDLDNYERPKMGGKR